MYKSQSTNMNLKYYNILNIFSHVERNQLNKKSFDL